GTPPASLSRLSGQPASFTFTASGTGPLSFQWQKDGSNIVGETGATLTIAAASPADNGAYRVVVTNACGSATSTAATLTVDARCSPADVANTDGDPVSDGTVDNGDFTAFFAAFFLDETDPGRLIADIADTDGATFIEGSGPDGSVDNGDFTAFFTYFFQGCPLPLP
ncbi:MAG: GC-type dockerin domain-anchored protein, partial [Phycisphaerales bacterium]